MSQGEGLLLLRHCNYDRRHKLLLSYRMPQFNRNYVLAWDSDTIGIGGAITNQPGFTFYTYALNTVKLTSYTVAFDHPDVTAGALVNIP